MEIYRWFFRIRWVLLIPEGHWVTELVRVCLLYTSHIEASGNAASYSDIYFADYHHINPSGDSVSSKTEYDHGLSDPFMQLYRKQSS